MQQSTTRDSMYLLIHFTLTKHALVVSFIPVFFFYVKYIEDHKLNHQHLYCLLTSSLDITLLPKRVCHWGMVVPDRTIWGYNILELFYMSIDECKEACRRDYRCLSADYQNAVYECRLNDVAEDTVPLTANAGGTYYQADCENLTITTVAKEYIQDPSTTGYPASTTVIDTSSVPTSTSEEGHTTKVSTLPQTSFVNPLTSIPQSTSNAPVVTSRGTTPEPQRQETSHFETSENYYSSTNSETSQPTSTPDLVSSPDQEMSSAAGILIRSSPEESFPPTSSVPVTASQMNSIITSGMMGSSPSPGSLHQTTVRALSTVPFPSDIQWEINMWTRWTECHPTSDGETANKFRIMLCSSRKVYPDICTRTLPVPNTSQNINLCEYCCSSCLTSH